MARLGASGGVAPPLLLLHGYPDNLQIFCRLAPLLAASGRLVVAFDWPGMGESEVWPGGTTPAHLADRLAVLCDAWDFDRVDLAGMDMGGQPALAFAARHAGRIGRLVVMNSLVAPSARTSWEIRVLRRFGWNRALLRTLPRLIFARAERTFLPPGVRLPEAVRDDLWRSFRRPEVRAFITRLCGGYDAALPRLPELYGRIVCPTLVLWGEHDRHFPPVHAETLAAALPKARLEILGRAEHWMVFDRAEEVAARIAAWRGGG